MASTYRYGTSLSRLSFFGLFFVLALFFAATPIIAESQSATVNDGHGKEWLQLPAAVGVSWNEIAQVCPQDGVTPCVGSAAGRNINRWVWATDAQVQQLFSLYDPDLQTDRSVEGLAHFGTAQTFLSTFRPTSSFCITYACGAFGGGWTATKDATGLPLIGSVGWGTTPTSASGSLGVIATADPDDAQSTRGIWLWRATGPGPHAYDDSGSVSSPAGGTALASVLGNDWIDGSGANTTNVTIIAGSSSSPGVTLDVNDGSVAVAPATHTGTYNLVYRICDVNNGSSCDDASVTVVVNPYVVDAINDAGWASPSTGGTAIQSVLANDRLSGGAVSTANVSLSLVSVSPATTGITLDPTDGSVDVARGTELGSTIWSTGFATTPTCPIAIRLALP